MNSTPITLGTGRIMKVEKFTSTLLKTIHRSISASPSKLIWLELDSHAFENIADPIILITSQTECCEEVLHTYHRPAAVNIYTNYGQRMAHLYHKKCDRCEVKYYTCYRQTKDGEKIFYPNSSDQKYFLISNRTGFETAYLVITSDLLETATANSFDALSNCYEITHGVYMDAQRLEEGYFMRKLQLLYATLNEELKVEQKDDTCRIDLELLCHRALQYVTLDQLISHSCTTPGCKQGFVMADGIEKLHRRVCAAPTTKLKLAKNMANIVSCCPNTPIHRSRFCADHAEHKIVLIINTVDLTVSTKHLPSTNNIPSNYDASVHAGCKKSVNVTRFTDRTAGVLAMVRPCGVIIHVSELLTCESPSQVFVQLLKLKSDSGLFVRYFGYDRSCEFHPFLANLSKKGNEGAKIILEGTDFIVDRFHIANHKTPKCDISSPDCQYHPDLPKFHELQAVNTECAEQCFSWLGRFKHCMKYMSQYKFRFLLFIIVTARNERTIQRIARRPVLNL